MKRSLALAPAYFGVAWARITSWWPDLFAGLLVCFGYASLLFGADDVWSVSITRALNANVTYAWLGVLVVAGGTLAYAMVAGRYTLAAIASSSISALLAMNAIAALLARGPGTISAVIGYSLASIYLAERAKQLDAKVPNMPDTYR